MTYFVSADQLKLQQMHQNQTEFPMQKTTITKNMSWPMSQPTKQQNRIHISINRKFGNPTQPPLPAQTTLCDYPYQQGGPFFDVSNLNLRNIAHQRVIQSPVLDDDILYSCKVIAQLQGNYELETSDGLVEISVILAKVTEYEEQYARVHLVSNDGNALADKFIYHELNYFKLCSADRKVEGVLMKGSNMKHSVRWWNANDEGWIVWRRKGMVTFNLVQVEPSSRRNSISSVCTVSTSSPVAHSIDTSTPGSDRNCMLNRLVLVQPRRPGFLNATSGGYSPTACLQSNSNNIFATASIVVSDGNHKKMFELIKEQCSKNTVLFKKVVEWAIANNRARPKSNAETEHLSVGRFWITAQLEDMGEGDVSIDILDDIKGAYQETSAGVYTQPHPKDCGSVVQHRLFKNEHGFWMIERQDLGCERWQIRARQQEGYQWVDFKNNNMPIRVHVVPMGKILEKLGEEHFVNRSENKKSIDFLFNFCNQEKLTKLKGRNLKHHIANLKVKLEKRYALSFGIRVANAAEAIAQEL